MGVAPTPQPWAALLLIALRGLASSSPPPTLDGDALLAAWQWHLTERACAHQTIKNNLSVARQFLAFAEERGKTPDQIDTTDLDAFLRRCRKVAVAGGGFRVTRRRILDSTAHTNERVIIRLFRWAHQEGHLQDDPFARRRGMRQPDPPERFVSREEYRLLRDAARAAGDLRLEVILALAFWLGLRAGSIAAARLEDIRWRTGRFAVRGKGTRGAVGGTVPMAPELVELLAAYTAGRRRRGRGPLIESATRPGSHILPARVSRIVNRHMRAHGVAETCHGIRHAAAWEIATVSTDPRAPKDFLLHKSWAATDIYLSGRHKHVDDAVAARPPSNQGPGRRDGATRPPRKRRGGPARERRPPPRRRPPAGR